MSDHSAFFMPVWFTSIRATIGYDLIDDDVFEADQ